MRGISTPKNLKDTRLAKKQSILTFWTIDNKNINDSHFYYEVYIVIVLFAGLLLFFSLLLIFQPLKGCNYLVNFAEYDDKNKNKQIEQK